VALGKESDVGFSVMAEGLMLGVGDTLADGLGAGDVDGTVEGEALGAGEVLGAIEATILGLLVGGKLCDGCGVRVTLPPPHAATETARTAIAGKTTVFRFRGKRINDFTF